jgi:acetolactate synthase-1/3 small subunit
MRKTLSLTVYNQSGVLTRISMIFSSRGLNIESIAVGPSEHFGISKIIVVFAGDYQISEQITKQLNKLIQVIEIKDITHQSSVECELILIKILSLSSTRTAILDIIQIFKGKIVDISENAFIIEVVGDSEKVKIIQELLKPYKILEIVRSGKIAIQR